MFRNSHLINTTKKHQSTTVHKKSVFNDKTSSIHIDQQRNEVKENIYFLNKKIQQTTHTIPNKKFLSMKFTHFT